jgi:hypothetical protein
MKTNQKNVMLIIEKNFLQCFEKKCWFYNFEEVFESMVEWLFKVFKETQKSI